VTIVYIHPPTTTHTHTHTHTYTYIHTQSAGGFLGLYWAVSTGLPVFATNYMEKSNWAPRLLCPPVGEFRPCVEGDYRCKELLNEVCIYIYTHRHRHTHTLVCIFRRPTSSSQYTHIHTHTHTHTHTQAPAGRIFLEVYMTCQKKAAAGVWQPKGERCVCVCVCVCVYV
jgi:hypothetical protein